jgi:AbrB family looped-hinge helix DNA binding protein
MLDCMSMKTHYKSMKTVVSERGQITLPKSIRNDLGIRAGTVLELSVVDGKIVGWKREGQDSVHKWNGRGKLPRGVSSVDDYLRAVRE